MRLLKGWFYKKFVSIFLTVAMLVTMFTFPVNVPVIDLHQKTGTWLTQIGDEASKAYFMTHAGDNTHLSYNGAVELNRMAKEEMERLGLPLNTYFK